jgi:predicted NACHT family NTPase
MTDRIVRQLVPKPEEVDQGKPFSEFSTRPNLVLLGAPGAGKTHLFTEAAAGGGKRVTTRDFLNIPSFPPNTVLFIDALDESRAGRGDQGTIDAVVKKLFEVKPKKVRISCRESDWLGKTDLAAFQSYFDQCGGCVVLALEQLTPDEQRAVLTAENIPNPDEFLEQARERDLDDLLGNPQNLLMLAKVVGGENWPRNRTELAERAQSAKDSTATPP